MRLPARWLCQRLPCRLRLFNNGEAIITNGDIGAPRGKAGSYQTATLIILP